MFNLRFDDTNPMKEKIEFVQSIIEDVKWIGGRFDDRLFFDINIYYHTIRLKNRKGADEKNRNKTYLL